MLEDNAEAPSVPRDIQDREGKSVVKGSLSSREVCREGAAPIPRIHLPMRCTALCRTGLDRWVTMNGAGVSGAEKAHALVRCSI